jgi:hypothetical protein
MGDSFVSGISSRPHHLPASEITHAAICRWMDSHALQGRRRSKIFGMSSMISLRSASAMMLKIHSQTGVRSKNRVF